MTRIISIVLLTFGVAACASRQPEPAPVAIDQSVAEESPAIAVTHPELTAQSAPVRLDRDKLAGLGLAEYEPYPPEMVLTGRSVHRSHVLFSGEELVVEVYEAEAAKLAITDPFPYDEFIYVLSGKLILTDATGAVSEYAQGESLVVPKGFTGGTWEMLGDFRELVVIEKRAYGRSE